MEEQFNYTYSANEQEEIRNIRSKYLSEEKEETPMEQLRRLDKSVTKTASAAAIITGIVGTLIMGVGMCFTMVSGWEKFFVLGVIVGLIGIALIAAAYPVYKAVLKHKRKIIAPEIIRLSDELMK